MIKRLRFAGRHAELGPGAGDAPPDVRPLRVAVASALTDHGDPHPRPAVVASEWFTDAVHLERCDAYAGSIADSSIIAEELVLRGADWLEQRWRDDGSRYKHVALARRAEGLTPAEFSARWRSHAGRSGGAVIPDEARGQAYVQNHPMPRADGEWPYDAVTEVWFDDLAGLRARIDWFAANPPTDDALFREHWFLACAEEVVLGEI